MNSDRITLIDATVLALQGKLALQESKEIKTEESINVSIEDNGCTIVDTDDATVIVQEQSVEEEIEEQPVEEETSEVDIATAEEVDTEEVDTEEVDTEEVDTEEVDTEEVVLDTDDATVEEIVDNDNLTESKEDKYIAKLEKEFNRKLTDEELRLIKAFAPIIEADAESQKEKKTEDISARPHHDDLLSAIEDGFVDYKTVAEACLSWLSDDDIKRMCQIYEWNIGTDELDENKQVETKKQQFSSKTFNKVIENYLKENKQDVESFRLTKLSKNPSKIKVEGIITSTNKTEENVCFKLNSIQQGKKYTKYELCENKSIKLENKSSESKLSMVTFLNNDNILECKYMINK